MNNINQSLNQSQKLLALIAHGLLEHSKTNTMSQLGDRSQYIGMSDISLMQECPRLAVLSKIIPKNQNHVTSENYEQILKKQLTLQRGHWLEDGIANALYANGYKLIPQLEIAIQNVNVNIKAHLDFVLIGSTDVRILELKSNANLSHSPLKSYELQIQSQVALLDEFWNEPVFNLKDSNGVLLYQDKTFPEICTAYLGLNLLTKDKYDLQGWLLCISMNEAKTFGPYFPNSYFVQNCFYNSKVLWELMEQYRQNSKQKIPHAKGFCLACTFCDYQNDCPKFFGIEQLEWEQTLQELQELKSQKDKLSDQISGIENQIKQSIYPTAQKGKWIEAGSHRFRVTEQAGRKSLDKDRLYADLSQVMGEEETINLFTKCELESAPSLRLYTQLIKN